MSRADYRNRVELDLTLDECRGLTLDEAMALTDTHYSNCLDAIEADGKEIAARFLLFSGGNDSTTLGHYCVQKGWPTHAVHANTGIGIERTRQFVRDMCQQWDLELWEIHPPAGATYRDLVIAHGFPGPAHHYKMFQRLKERAVDEARRRVVGRDGRRKRVILLGGMRAHESARRARTSNIVDRDGSQVWLSPFVHWTNEHLMEYRKRFDVPRNDVADLIHMSGECLCGAYAKANELDEIGMWFPEVRDEIQALEAEVLAAGNAPVARCTWGWGSGAKTTGREKSGPMCSSCDATRQLTFDDVDQWIDTQLLDAQKATA